MYSFFRKKWQPAVRRGAGSWRVRGKGRRADRKRQNFASWVHDSTKSWTTRTSSSATTHEHNSLPKIFSFKMQASRRGVWNHLSRKIPRTSRKTKQQRLWITHVSTKCLESRRERGNRAGSTGKAWWLRSIPTQKGKLSLQIVFWLSPTFNPTEFLLC